MRVFAVVFPIALGLGTMVPVEGMLAQSAPAKPIADGTFIGRDSLDAAKEAATPSRVRSALGGVATWAIERDSLDLRRKFTIRLTVAGDAPIAVVLRWVDSVPPRPGDYDFMIPSTGASHHLTSQVHGDIYAREAGGERAYGAFRSRVTIASSATRGGQHAVIGNIAIRSQRYADARPTARIFDYVSLHIGGRFNARASTEPSPSVQVTPAMQEAVLRRALDGFVITSSGAVNGDGGADSTRQSTLARHFLESRWREVAAIESLSVDRGTYYVRLLGRLSPVTCETESGTEETSCTTLPMPIDAAGAAGNLSGSLTVPRAERARVRGKPVTVYLLPNPVPVRQAIGAFCDKQEQLDSVMEAELTVELAAARTPAQRSEVEKAYIARASSGMPAYRADYHAAFASSALHRAEVLPGARYVFAGVRPGNYLLFAAIEGGQRVDWYVPIGVHAGESVTRDLGESNVSAEGWACDTPLPFPAVHQGRR